ncbi:MAG: glutamine-hydrolyzing carbamoyl-phosphate synthase small subunit [Candidatus Delongbacteria bacterium]|nr:glutamine-hydrolyzing carbamoyl-phosphate synthase small subunit [Candidatus Delongbacteria bacterium]
MNQKAILYLDDGTILWGSSFGAPTEKVGEVVFNTGMSGYQEVLTDPSYKGQLVTLTYPECGNYGINTEDHESEQIYAEGLIVREYHHAYSNFRADKSLDQFLKDYQVPGISEIDTRKLTRILREKGCMVGVISSVNFKVSYLRQKIQEFGSMVGKNLVKTLNSRQNRIWRNEQAPFQRRIAVLDYGCKFQIIRELLKHCSEVSLFGWECGLDEITSYAPDGILISNGPGDPAPLCSAVSLITQLIPRYPMFGICLGHQLLGLAAGGTTLKLKYGHHGLNHPVKRLSDGQIHITSQNHNFAVDPESLPADKVEITFMNLNDQTNEGMRFRNYPVFSVQFHPEAAPGPHDTAYLFEEFIRLVHAG